MEEGIVNKKTGGKLHIAAAVVFLIIIMLIGIKWKLASISNENLSIIIGYEVELKDKTHMLKYCREDMAEMKTNMEELKNRLEGIKNNTDLLKRDIFLYIDKKFQIVPQSVAIKIADIILSISKKENISPELIMAIIQVESGFNPMAISKANARGLMQVMPEWAPKFNLKKVSDLHDIDTGIEIGVKVLKIHIDEAKGNISKGLYYYVGKSDAYSGKVYAAIGKFVSFRSTVDDEKPLVDETPKTKDNANVK